MGRRDCSRPPCSETGAWWRNVCRPRWHRWKPPWTWSRRYIDGTRKRINSRVLLPCADILCDGVRWDAGTAPDHLAQKRALGGEMFAGLVGIDGSHHGPGLVAISMARESG